MGRGSGSFLFGLLAGLVVAIFCGISPLDARDEESYWDHQLDRAEKYLGKSGEQAALKVVNLCEELFEKHLSLLPVEKDQSVRLARFLTLMAIGDMRSGSVERGRWRILEAANFDRDMTLKTSKRFSGSIGELSRALKNFDPGRIVEQARRDGENFVSPRPVGMVPINFATPGLSLPSGGKASVIVLVGVDGMPRAPVLEKSSSVSTFDLAVMESARLWVFSPAQLEGKPVEGVYFLTAQVRSQG